MWAVLRMFGSRRKAEQRRLAEIWKDPLAVEAKIKEIIAEELKKDIRQVSLETNTYDEGVSVGNLEVVMGCEYAFGINIPDEDAEKLIIVGDLIHYIQEKLRKQSDGPSVEPRS